MAMHVRHHDVTHYRSSNKNVRQILARLYSRLRDIDTAPESAPEFVLDSTTFYVPLHLQIEETPTIEQQRLYVERFANFKKKYKGKFDELLNLIKDEHYEHEYDLLFGDEEQVKQPHGQHIFMLNGKLHSASLCSNPLNLAIICLLIISDELQNIKSRTELYKCVTKFLVKKASERMKRPKEKIEADIIRPLCRLAFEAFKKNKVYLTNVDLANSGVDAVDVVRSGFLTKNVKVRLLADPVEYFSFSHKTFHKFLAATHMTQTPNDLKDWLKTITAGQWWSERLDSLQLLLFDLLLEYLLVDEAFIVERFSLSQD
ncbi:hypothetical protein CAPTEDRAFT_200868 [Capitella teleta]|uniref:NOD1/2 winged helix domain-containing protein n=1 Tax=Capitella teleta TaxID=283909 RepID=R7TBS3_CAPTE|nr:hypothetical protein CAPTEDRAFT_200868 [Capitella teleta]|eukprot:ELT88937.1 hypothetical protein CAPTEDRAFT_200868 [Capitella teleta]